MIKKALRAALILCIAGVVAISVVGCFGAAEEQAGPEVGKYQLYYMESQGIVIEGEQLELAMATSGGLANQYIEIKSNKSFTMNLNGEELDVPFAIDGDTITWQDEAGLASISFDGDTLIWVASDELAGGKGLGFTMKFKKK
ncbi:MAG: hypothetical protein LBP91_04885 [Coriobacteriales bacterium]|nr:hypothetical protein [Coriobacteriales bacterium]